MVTASDSEVRTLVRDLFAGSLDGEEGLWDELLRDIIDRFFDAGITSVERTTDTLRFTLSAADTELERRVRERYGVVEFSYGEWRGVRRDALGGDP